MVGACAPDLVIHLGDLSLDGARSAADLRHGRTQLDRLPAAWRAVPGNHDVGDNPWPGAPAGSAVDAARRQRWLDIVGTDHWSVTAAGWMVLAVNAQLLGSGLTPPALVMSGHVHQYRLLRLEGTDHLWVPTTWAVLPDQAQPVLGAKRCGIVSLTLDTGTPSKHELIEPDGLGAAHGAVDAGAATVAGMACGAVAMRAATSCSSG